MSVDEENTTRGPARRARLRDVAELSGVSIRTVSNVVTGGAFVAPETRTRVEAAIERLQYRPNLSARRLRSGRANLIGMLVPEIDVPYFADLARRMRDEAASNGYRLLVEQADGNEAAEREFLSLPSASGFFDGMIVNPLVASEEHILSTAGRTPLVVIGEHATSDRVHQVGIDNFRAACDATEHLVAQGRRRLAVVGVQSQPGGDTAQGRLDGFLHAAKRAGLGVSDDHLLPTPRFHREHGAAAGRRLLALGELPDGIFCFNDQLAIGLMHVLVSAGVRVPDDVAIVGFDDSAEGRYSNPGLTTIAPDVAGITRTSIQLLLSMIDGSGPPPGRTVLPHELKVRGSTVRAD